MVMEIRKEYREYYVLQKHCPVCKDWPPAERKARRLEIETIPNAKLCIRCDMEWWAGFHRYYSRKERERTPGVPRRLP